jgi:ABC-type multidrug transport system ATPase subunit
VLRRALGSGTLMPKRSLMRMRHGSQNMSTTKGQPREMAVVEIDALSRSFRHRGVVLEAISLKAEAGDKIAVTGPNGSGKTTLLRCIAGSVKPTSGSIRVCGHPAGTLEAKNRLGVSLSQERSFFLRLTGRRNLEYFAQLRRRPSASSKKEVGDLVDELEIGDIVRQRVDRCSTGMIQQLTFARALLGRPELLLLDEPTRSLDTQAAERLWGALDRRSETAVLIATHRVEDEGRCNGQFALG